MDSAYPTPEETARTKEKTWLKKYGKIIKRVADEIDKAIESEPDAIPWLCCQVCKVLDAAITKAQGKQDAD